MDSMRERGDSQSENDFNFHNGRDNQEDVLDDQEQLQMEDVSINLEDGMPSGDEQHHLR